MLKVLASLWLGLLSAACQQAPVRPAFSYSANVGLLTGKGGHDCLYIANAGLSPGQRVQFVTAATPQTAGEAEIVGKAGDTCKDSTQGGGMTPYSFKITQGALPKGAPAIAIANLSRPLTPGDRGAIGDLEGDGQREYFRTCTSTEGLHLTIWKGKPLEGSRRWHYYYYLGYDVTPDCTDSETKPDTGQ